MGKYINFFCKFNEYIKKYKKHIKNEPLYLNNLSFANLPKMQSVSSSAIRRLIEDQKPCRHLVTPGVFHYIKENKLYQLGESI